MPREVVPDPTRSLDPIWTWLGSAIVGASALTAFYVRSGASSIFPGPDTGMQDDVVVSVAYWGLLISTSGLAALGAIASRYRSRGDDRDGFAWPRFTLIEADVRDPLVAKGALAALTLIPLLAWVICLVAYSKSRIALWSAQLPLSDGFVSSRWAALQTACTNQPCFRMHPLDGVPPYAMQWFSYLNEPALVLLTAYAVYVWMRWATVHRKSDLR
jgi:hypothetical protein